MSNIILLIALGLCQQTGDSARVIEYLHTARHADGGYGQTPATTTSSLSATTSALRALKQWGGEPKEVEKTKAYVWSCFQSATGQFAETPKGEPNYHSTAVGVMAIVALREQFTPDDLIRIQNTLLNSDQPEDIRLGAAAMESLLQFEYVKSIPLEWRAKLKSTFQKDRNADGTYGVGSGQARMTASYVVSYIRLRYLVQDSANVIECLKSRQLSSGSWLNDKGDPDLETCYRVMRCLCMMRCTDPKMISQCEKFIASCKQADGGYGVGQSSVSGTYFAGEILHWLAELRK